MYRRKETIHKKKTQNNKKAPQAIKQSKFITLPGVLMHLRISNAVTYRSHLINVMKWFMHETFLRTIYHTIVFPDLIKSFPS